MREVQAHSQTAEYTCEGREWRITFMGDRLVAQVFRDDSWHVVSIVPS